MFKICLDPGHAKGSDKHGCNGFSEEAHNLLMAQSLKKKLESTGKFTVCLTRDNEISDPSLTERGRTAAKHGCDMIVSMHTNGAQGTAHGVSVFHSVDLPGDKPMAQEFADEIAKAIGTDSRGACVHESVNHPGEDYLTVIDSAQDAGTPHVFLSESGFHDNPGDWAKMHTPEGIDKIASAHAKVICKHYGVVWPVAPVVVPKPPVPTAAYYYVANGDNLFKIGKKFGVKWEIIAKRNSITDPHALRVGQKLIIPHIK